MKINKSHIKNLPLFSIIFLLNSCSFLNILSPSAYQLIRDGDGNKILRDTKSHRDEFKSTVDFHIGCEIKKYPATGSKSHSWRVFWMNRIKFIRNGSENPQWYINYILEARRAARLPEL
jgi:hypothetical protein